MQRMAAGMWTKTGRVHSLCGAVLLCLIILLGCSAGDPCPSKLQFRSSRGCLNCSLCNKANDAQEYKNHNNDECKKKNPEPIHTGNYLWCAKPGGPYPTCQELEHLGIHEFNCSHGPVFNASVSCMIKCGDKRINITCSENITWVPDPRTCPPPPTTETPVTQNSTSPIVGTPLSLKEENSTDIIIAVIAVIAVLAVVGCVTFIGFILRSRCHRMSNSHNRSSSQSSCSQTASVTESIEGAGEESNGLLESGCGPADADRLIQTQEVQHRSTYTPRAEVWQFPVGNSQEVTMSHQPYEGNVTDAYSYFALVDFLNDRETALRFCHFFDQKDGFCNVTWHNIANCLLQKKHDEIKAFEYRSLPTHGDQLSGMPTFRILGEVKQRGLGLLELRKFLESELKEKPDADSAKKGITLLDDFLSKWVAKKRTTALPNTRV